MIEWCTGMLFLSLFSVQFPFVTLFLARRFFDKTLFHFLGLAHDGTINLYSACKNRSVLLQKFLQILALFHLPFCLSPNLLRAETGVSQSAQQWFWVGLHLPPSRLYISLAVFVWVDLLMFFQISQLHNSNSGLLDHSYLRFLMLFQGPVKWPKWQTWTARVSCVVNRRMYVALEHWLSIWALLWLSLFELLTAYSCKEANTSGLRPDSTVHIHTSHLQKYIYIYLSVYMFLLQSSSDILTLKSPSLFTDHSLPLSRRPPRVVFIVTVMQMVTPNLYPNTSQVTHGISWHLTMKYERDDEMEWIALKWLKCSNLGNVNALPVEAS